jgi:hypothetical protein
MRAIHELDPTLPLSQALVDVLTRPNVAGESFNLGKTLLVVPAGRLARAVERRLLDRARGASSVLEAPSIVTPLMLFGRFIAPTKPLLSRIGAEASWRESIEQIAATDPALCAKVAAAFGSPPELPNRLRPRVAKRLAKLSAGGGESGQLRATIEDHLKTSRERLENIDDAKRKLDVVAAEIERLESKIAALAEGSVAKRDMSDIAQRVDEVAEGMRRTDETMRQLQLPPELEDLEEPPQLLREEA